MRGSPNYEFKSIKENSRLLVTTGWVLAFLDENKIFFSELHQQNEFLSFLSFFFGHIFPFFHFPFSFSWEMRLLTPNLGVPWDSWTPLQVYVCVQVYVCRKVGVASVGVLVCARACIFLKLKSFSSRFSRQSQQVSYKVRHSLTKLYTTASG